MGAIVDVGRVVVVSPPATEPVSLDEAKRHLGLEDSTDHDERIAPLCVAARQQVEGDTGRAACTQTLDIYFDAVPCGGYLTIPMPPLVSVTSVTTYSRANVGTVMSSGDYLVDTASEPARIVLNDGKAWPADLRAANAIVVRIVAGYTASTLPVALKQAMLLLIGSLSEHREQVIVSQFAGQFLEVPYGYKQLIAAYRRWNL